MKRENWILSNFPLLSFCFNFNTWSFSWWVDGGLLILGWIVTLLDLLNTALKLFGSSSVSTYRLHFGWEVSVCFMLALGILPWGYSAGGHALNQFWHGSLTWALHHSAVLVVKLEQDDRACFYITAQINYTTGLCASLVKTSQVTVL